MGNVVANSRTSFRSRKFHIKVEKERTFFRNFVAIYSSGDWDLSHNCLWNWAQEKSSGEYVYYCSHVLQVLNMEANSANS